MGEKTSGKLKQSLMLAAKGKLDIPIKDKALANCNGELIEDFLKLLDNAKADFPYTVWKGNPEDFTFFKKSKDPEKSFSLDTGFLEMHGALRK
jgi:hypothetical protein